MPVSVIPDAKPARRKCTEPKSRGVEVRLNRWERRTLRRLVRRIRHADVQRRLLIILHRSAGWTYRPIAGAACCSIGTVSRVLNRWKQVEWAALMDRREDNGDRKIDARFLKQLARVLQKSPPDFGWPRPTWTQELLILVLKKRLGVAVCRATMSRALQVIGARRGRPKPYVQCPWRPRAKTRRLNQIKGVIATLRRNEAAFWEDEVDIHLNPKIGLDWMLWGQQRRVRTPGQNEKRYIAGALNARTGRMIWVAGSRKNSALFIQLVLQLLRAHPRARVIHVILDNYGIHKSRQVEAVLASLHGRVRLHFLPPYCPDDNPIERVWEDFHGNVTRNHRHRTMDPLMAAGENYLHARNRKVLPALIRVRA